MCRFIKEDGERCGNDTEPFCHLHEETPQSHFYHSMEELKEDLGEVMEMVEEASDSSVSGFSPPEGVTTCDRCETAVRPICADLSPAAFQPASIVVSLALACECFTREWYPNDTLDAQEVPDQWMTE